jgi:translation initiation factor 5
MLNIRQNNDPNYRYKMPKMVIKQERQLKITNLSELAKSLHTKPKYIIKYFGYELGTSSNYSSTESTGILNGNYSYELLKELLYSFIDKFIVCPECDLPETKLKLNSDNTKLKMKCDACGHRCKIKNHKLVDYIIKDLIEY